MKPHALRVMIVDDHPIMRASIRQIFTRERGVEVVAEAGCAEEALEHIGKHGIDVVTLDISLPGESGVELLTKLRQQQPHLAILVLTMHPEQSFAVRLIRAGASGYMSKLATPDELLKAVRTVGSGRRYITPAVAELLASGFMEDEGGPVHRLLSQRELQIFTRMARGVAPQVMAGELGLSVKTVSTYRSRIFEKMNITSNAQLAAYAVRHQLVD
jgi:DNA-binding NarL/FixJ family response regulator